ncbi:glutathione S-transferase family protein [Acuticoccus kandeliae]|uniref:glutathione S-transferase family protein n=1 Tax=Acuticoccus kandeliae TaxID=2073160 RepID=UPI000D3E55FC|nr:glutathione S-transferase family protein [Acuticoccus kandeliae]
MALTLVIGNKNYSSWSLRAWLVLDHFGFTFHERLIVLDQPDTKARLLDESPAGRVPVLIDGQLAVWESLSIIEYCAELKPEAGIWPRAARERAIARTLASEMHAGFMGLRQACPMNLKARRPFRPRGAAAEADVARFEAMVAERIAISGGPFLFGPWCAADAMYAPVVTRLTSYGWPLADTTRAYADAVETEASFLRWKEAALRETWILPAEEVE